MIQTENTSMSPYRTDLIKLNTQDITKAYPITDSLIIAKEFNKRHDNVIRDIENLKNSLLLFEERSTSLYRLHEEEYKTTQGNTYKKFTMNEPFFMLLVMGFTGQKALQIKNEFIQSFYFMQQELLMRSNTRSIGKLEGRRPLTDSINQALVPGKFKNFAYSNYTKLVYKHILGTTVKKYKAKYNLPDNSNIRDFFSTDQLSKLHIIETKIAGIIEFFKDEDDKVVYDKVKEYLIENKATLLKGNKQESMNE